MMSSVNKFPSEDVIVIDNEQVVVENGSSTEFLAVLCSMFDSNQPENELKEYWRLRATINREDVIQKLKQLTSNDLRAEIIHQCGILDLENYQYELSDVIPVVNFIDKITDVSNNTDRNIMTFLLHLKSTRRGIKSVFKAQKAAFMAQTLNKRFLWELREYTTLHVSDIIIEKDKQGIQTPQSLHHLLKLQSCMIAHVPEPDRGLTDSELALRNASDRYIKNKKVYWEVVRPKVLNSYLHQYVEVCDGTVRIYKHLELIQYHADKYVAQIGLENCPYRIVKRK
jgi:hypothetical protein